MKLFVKLTILHAVTADINIFAGIMNLLVSNYFSGVLFLVSGIIWSILTIEDIRHVFLYKKIEENEKEVEVFVEDCKQEAFSGCYSSSDVKTLLEKHPWSND